jgi:hypothetical protein
MNYSIDMKEIKEKAYKRQTDDGIFDLVVGSTLLVVSLLLFIKELDILWIAIIGALIGSIPVLKNKITYPRIGYVRFSRERIHHRNIMLVFIAVGFLTLCGLIIFFQLSDKVPSTAKVFVDRYLEIFMLIYVAVVLLGIMIIFGHAERMKRLYYYIALVTIFLLFHRHFDFKVEYYLLIMGTLMTSIGAVLLVKFLKKYPQPAHDPHYEI